MIQEEINNAFDASYSSTSEDYVLKGNIYSGGSSTNAKALDNLDALRDISLPLFQNTLIGDYSLRDSTLKAGSNLSTKMCIELSWENIIARFVGTNSSCAEILLNGVASKPTKD